MIAEVMADLRENEPAVIFVTDDEVPPPPELAEVMNAKYRYAGQVNYAKLYVLNRGRTGERSATDSPGS